MMFDTDVLIWILRGNENAARLIEDADDRCLSVVSYMELLQGARDRQESRTIKGFLGDFGFRVLPLTENVGHRASIYIEEYALKSRLCMADALVAATAVENGVALCTADRKHYRLVKDLEISTFRP